MFTHYMTTKQQQILNAAFDLFSNEGFHAISTNKIAKLANVSEGLIFRHFINKEGLLDSIYNKLKLNVDFLFLEILNEEEPKDIIKKTLDIPFKLDDNEIRNLKLLYKLQWELNNNSVQVFEIIKNKLSKAFEKLRYKHAELEAEFLMQHLNGLTSAIIRNQILNKESTKALLLRKYHLQ